MNTELVNPFMSFPQNTTGEDYVIGDLHGELNVLEAALDFLGFDKDKDRLFSVGDLIDRGPFSKEIIELIPQGWLFPVLGNHESMLLDFTDCGDLREEAWYANGGEWWKHLYPGEKKQIKDIITQHFAYALQIDTGFGTVGLVHGDVPNEVSWQDIANDLQQKQEFVQHILWSRKTVAEEIHKQVEGLSCLCVGHTRKKDAMLLGNILALDTGSGYKHSLEFPCPALSIAHIQQDAISVFKFAGSLVLSKERFAF